MICHRQKYRVRRMTPTRQTDTLTVVLFARPKFCCERCLTPMVNARLCPCFFAHALLSAAQQEQHCSPSKARPWTRPGCGETNRRKPGFGSHISGIPNHLITSSETPGLLTPKFACYWPERSGGGAAPRGACTALSPRDSSGGVTIIGMWRVCRK